MRELRAFFRGFVSGLSTLYLPALVAFALLVGFYACAAKPFVCPTLRILADNCPLYLVELPDRSVEPVPREEIAKLATGLRASRLAAAAAAGKGPSDGGAE